MTVKVMMSPTLGVASLTVLVRRQVGLLRRLGGAAAVVGRCSGRTGRRRVIVAVFVCAAGLTTVALMVRVGGAAAGHRADVPHAGARGRRCPGWGWPTRRSGPAGSRSVTCTPVARVRPAVGQGDGEGDLVADVGRRVAHRSW